MIDEKENVFYNAKTVVICFGNRNAIHPEQDVALAMENMMLEAEYLGLGSCWIDCVRYFFNSGNVEQLKELFNVGKEYDCYGSLVIGYPDEVPEMKPRKENVITIIR